MNYLRVRNDESPCLDGIEAGARVGRRSAQAGSLSRSTISAGMTSGTVGSAGARRRRATSVRTGKPTPTSNSANPMAIREFEVVDVAYEPPKENDAQDREETG